jgi:hypothetical protein
MLAAMVDFLQEAEGKAIIHDLVKHSDVLLENFVPGMWAIRYSRGSDISQHEIDLLYDGMTV